MAKQIDNEKGFLEIETSMTECVEKFGGLGICDLCNNADFTGYYIAVLNSWYCQKCYQEWLSRAIRYKEDIPFEQRRFDQYSKLLGI